MKRLCLLTVVIFLVTGCAGVEITKITRENPYKQGIKFYRPHPYLWVTKDKKGNLQATIVWLPKKNEEYAINVKSGIGTAHAEFTLQDGWNLTQFGETRDSKTVQMIAALTGSLKGLTGIFTMAVADKDRPGILEMVVAKELHPGFYVFIFDAQTGFIKDLKAVVQFKP